MSFWIQEIKLMKKYKALNQNVFLNGEFKIVPICFENRIDTETDWKISELKYKMMIGGL